MKKLLPLCLIALLLGCLDRKQQAKIDELESQLKEVKESQRQQALKNSPSNEKAIEQRSRKQHAMQLVKNDIKRITVVVDDYDSDGVGSLSNVVLKLDNPTKYAFDYLAANVTYVKANQEVFKTEKVYFYKVEPYSVRTEKAPDSNRGTTLTAELVDSRSSELERVFKDINEFK